MTTSIDEALVGRLLEAQFPHWSHLPVTQVLPGGWDNRTFRIGDALAARLPSAEHYVAAVAKEQVWLSRLAPELPLPIPAPVALGEPAEDYPWPWSINRWLAGEPASSGAFDAEEFARDLAAFQRALYTIDASDGPPAGAHNFHRGGDLAVYDGMARKAIARLKDRIDVELALATWLAARSSQWRAAPVWVHGDMAAGNLLVDGGRLAAVIDFGSSAVGDPACDLVIAWTLLPEPARTTYRNAIAFDDDTWARARGWALWKATIMLSGVAPGPHDPAHTMKVLETVLAEHRALC